MARDSQPNNTISPPKLSDLLFVSERKDRAMSLMKMIELGYLPSVYNPNEMKKIEDMQADLFLYILAKATKATNLEKHAGAFSTALIDFGFGDGPVECVIKVGISQYEGDRGFDYLRYCKAKGGRNYCTGFPDVYYLGRVKTLDRDVDIAVIEYVNVLKDSAGTSLSYKLSDLVDATYDRWGLDWRDETQAATEFKAIESVVQERQQLLDRFGWTVQDFAKFIGALGAVGGQTDIKRENLGLRNDNTVCVFDPISQ
jgi:hypothetical protein